MPSCRTRCPRRRRSLWTGRSSEQVAAGAFLTAERLRAIFQEDRSRIEEAGRRAGSGLRVHETLKVRPIQTLPAICDATGLSFPAVSSAMGLLVDRGIARYLDILNEGTPRP